MQLKKSTGFDLLQSMRARLAYLAVRSVGAESSKAVGEALLAPKPGACNPQTPADTLAGVGAIEQVLLGTRRRQTRSAKRKWEQAQAGTASAGEGLRGGGGLNRRALQQRQARQRPELAAQPGRVRRVGTCSGAGQQCQ